MGELTVIGNSPTNIAGEVIEGEMRFTWSISNPEDVVKAEKIFREYTEKGWLAIGEVGEKKMQIFAFNPDLEKIVLFPVSLGG